MVITINFHDTAEEIENHITTCSFDSPCFVLELDKAQAERDLQEFIETDDTQIDEYEFYINAKVGERLYGNGLVAVKV
jgi:hypothetical protein